MFFNINHVNSYGIIKLVYQKNFLFQIYKRKDSTQGDASSAFPYFESEATDERDTCPDSSEPAGCG